MYMYLIEILPAPSDRDKADVEFNFCINLKM